MTGRIDLPSRNVALESVRSHTEQLRRICEAAARPAERLRALVAQVQIPEVSLPQSSINALDAMTRHHVDIGRLTMPKIQPSDYYSDAVRRLQAISERQQAAMAPLFEQQRRWTDAVNAIKLPVVEPIPMPHISQVAAAPCLDLEAFPESVTPVPARRRRSRAERVVAAALARLADQRRRDADGRHRVEMFVSLLNGELVRMIHLTTESEGLIRIVGVDMNGDTHDIYTGVDVFQYRIAGFTLPPSRPKLKSVQ